MSDNIFTGCIPALMTPCTAERKPDFDALVAKGRELIDIGMSAVVYCGSMGDWPLLTDAERQEGGTSGRCGHSDHRWYRCREQPRGDFPRGTCGQSRRPWPDGDSPRAVPGRLASRAKSPLRRHSERRAKAAVGDLQQPLLRLRH